MNSSALRTGKQLNRSGVINRSSIQNDPGETEKTDTRKLMSHSLLNIKELTIARNGNPRE